MKRTYSILTLLLLIASRLFAQDGRFTATLSKSTVGTGEQFEINFSVNAEGSNFTPPDLSGFQLLSGPNVSTSMEFINGKSTMSSSFSYILMATKEGTYPIGPASIVIGGRRLSSNAVRLTVVKGRPVPKSAQNQAVGGAGDQEPVRDLSKLLFVRAIVDKNNVYQGQQITLTYKLYTRVDILQNQANKIPDLNGFWNEEVKGPTEQYKTETYKGVQYNVVQIKQMILFPEHSGNIIIDPLEMTFIARVQTQPRDFMDQFFGRNVQDVKYTAKSIPVVVHVKPLPDAGRPEGYTGAVGSFRVNASVDKNQLKSNEALNYKVKVSGTGNLKLLKNLNPDFPADFEKYDPKITDSVTEDVNGVSGTRIYNYLLIPRHRGDFTINAAKFSYFNPNTGKYVSLSTQSFNIKVDKGLTEDNVTSLNSDDKQDVKLLDKDIHYIKTGNADLNRINERFYGSVSYYLLLLLGPLLCVVAFLYRNWQREKNKDVVKIKSRRAGKVAAKHLAKAQTELQTNNTQAFYEAIFKGLYGYLSDKLNIAYADLDRETITSALQKRSTSAGVISQLLETLDLCEMARYAPVTHIAAQEVFEKAKNIINAIENEI